jgi:hypothetical protein
MKNFFNGTIFWRGGWLVGWWCPLPIFAEDMVEKNRLMVREKLARIKYCRTTI